MNHKSALMRAAPVLVVKRLAAAFLVMFAAMALGSEGLAKTAAAASADAAAPPNIIIILADDHGYADWGKAAEQQGFETPNLDHMAAQGVYLDNFYVAQAICSASRAALLTGSYSNRIGISFALDFASKVALNPNEITIAELLKTRGYATGIVGKWHLGSTLPYMPLRQGFDEYFGLPYSHDMWPYHPVTPNYYPPLPLYDGERVVELNPDPAHLTERYSAHAIDFIHRHRNQPFFLYLAHNMPHVPLGASARFRGKSKRGLYGDAVEELDWSVGQVLDALKKEGIDRRTLVIFASDNGPWKPYGDHAGSADPLRGEKATTFDGGTRVPFIAWWPGHIPAGEVIHTPAMTIDLFPTVARLAGARMPTDRVIDGRDIWPVLSGKTKAPPHDALYFYWGNALQAVLSGRWKLHLPHTYTHTVIPGHGGLPGTSKELKIGESLYDMEADPGESRNVAAEHPDVVARMMRVVEQAREELGDSVTGQTGRDLRRAAVVDPPSQARSGQRK